MFPLKIWRWWNTNVLGKPYFVFDACAQYLTSPIAPPLLKAASDAQPLLFFLPFLGGFTGNKRTRLGAISVLSRFGSKLPLPHYADTCAHSDDA